MKEKISADVLFNRRVNYIVIEKMWEYLNKGKDKQGLYDLLDINKNAYSRIRMADSYNCVNLDKRWEAEKSALRKIGLSKEIMTGLELIQVGEITQEEWKRYIDSRYKIAGQDNYRTSIMQAMNGKLKDVFSRLEANKRDKSDIGKLYYFFIYGRAVTLDMPDAEMVDLRDSLMHVSVEKMKICDKDLRKEIYERLREAYKQLDIIIKYDELKG